jgi:hypothetical protein
MCLLVHPRKVYLLTSLYLAWMDERTADDCLFDSSNASRLLQLASGYL